MTIQSRTDNLPELAILKYYKTRYIIYNTSYVTEASHLGVLSDSKLVDTIPDVLWQA